MNSSRFLAFYDAVLAIVMTILVLSFNTVSYTHLTLPTIA